MVDNDGAGAILHPRRGFEMRLRFVIPEDGHSDAWWIREIQRSVSVCYGLRAVEGGAVIGQCPPVPIAAAAPGGGT